MVLKDRDFWVSLDTTLKEGASLIEGRACFQQASEDVYGMFVCNLDGVCEVGFHKNDVLRRYNEV